MKDIGIQFYCCIPLGSSLKNLNNCSYNHGQLINDQENQDRCKTKRTRIPTCIYKKYHHGDDEGSLAGRPVPLCFCKCVINDRELVAPPNPHHCMNIQNAPFKYTNVIGFFHWLSLSLSKKRSIFSIRIIVPNIYLKYITYYFVKFKLHTVCFVFFYRCLRCI